MLSSSQESRRPGTNFLLAETPGVAPRSVRTGLRSRIPVLVAGDARQVPGSPHLAAARAPAGPCSSCQGPHPPPPRLVPAGVPVPPPGGLRASGAMQTVPLAV